MACTGCEKRKAALKQAARYVKRVVTGTPRKAIEAIRQRVEERGPRGYKTDAT